MKCASCEGNLSLGSSMGHYFYVCDKCEKTFARENPEKEIQDWRSLPCVKCELPQTPEGHDPCIANLPGVAFACCGHGKPGGGYVAFANGVSIHGIERFENTMWSEDTCHKHTQKAVKSMLDSLKEGKTRGWTW